MIEIAHRLLRVVREAGGGDVADDPAGAAPEGDDPLGDAVGVAEQLDGERLEQRVQRREVRALRFQRATFSGCTGRGRR